MGKIRHWALRSQMQILRARTKCDSQLGRNLRHFFGSYTFCTYM